MRRAVPAVLIALSILAVTATDTQARTVTVSDYQAALKHAYQYRHHGGDFRAFGGADHARARLKRWRRQAVTRHAHAVMVARTRARAARWRWHRKIDAMTPWGPWAIPSEIVACESGGSWTADNPTSDARGPYQLLGHGEPWPVVTVRDYAQHHLIAAALYAGGAGRSHWVC